jgi:hypothetical protein
MVDTAQATITIPDVTETPDAPSVPARPGGVGDTGGTRPGGSVSSRLRTLAGAGRGGGGGRSDGTRSRSTAGGRIDLRNTWQIAAGSILIPLGVVFILMAWYGAAHTSYVQQQIPYLVSGSFVGLGCLVLGGLLYWAHWLYRIYDQADLHHHEQLQALEQTLRAMSERLGGADTPAAGTAAVSPAITDAPAGTGVAGRYPPPPPSPRPAPPSYVVTPTGSVYHLPSCPVVAHHPEGLRSVSPGAVADLVPCRICRPDAR